MEAEEGFDPERCSGYFRECCLHLHDIPIQQFLAACEEIKKIVATLGHAFVIASSDITEKVGIIQHRAKEMNDLAAVNGVEPPRLASQDSGGASAGSAAGGAGDNSSATASGTDSRPDSASSSGSLQSGPVRYTLQWMIDWEIERKVERQNTWSYVSGTRSLLRLMWFLDFVHTLLRHIVTSPDSELRESAVKAYDEALAHHHPWILRKTIGAAMLMLPSKASFLAHLAGRRGDQTDLQARLTTFVDSLNPVREELWRVYTSKGLTDLP